MGGGGRVDSHRKVAGGRILTVQKALKIAGISISVSAAVAVLFYHSPWGLCVLPVAVVLSGRYLNRVQKKQELMKLNLEFKDYLYAVSAALAAGYSVEQAFVAGLKDIRQLYGERCVLAERLGEMEKRLSVNEPMERILGDFAGDSGSEDIENFVEIFCYAKRGGGDFIHIIATSTGRICDKMEVLGEIHTVMAEKELEQKIMCLIPAGVLLFFKVTSPEFIGKLYGNMLGVLVMSVSLVLYAAAFFLGMKIVDIEV